jgi:hypothetical protein
MTDLVWFGFVALAALAIVALYVKADRSRTIAAITLEGGKARVTRGRLAAAPLAELGDVAKRMRVTRGSVVIRKQSGEVEVVVRDVPANAEQQIRNALGRFQLAQLRG